MLGGDADAALKFGIASKCQDHRGQFYGFRTSSKYDGDFHILTRRFLGRLVPVALADTTNLSPIDRESSNNAEENSIGYTLSTVG